MSTADLSEAENTQHYRGKVSATEFVRKLQEYVESLTQDQGGGQTEQMLEDVGNLIDDFPSIESGDSPVPDSKPYQDAYNSAIALWNLAVALKANSSAEEDGSSINAQMRHSSCRLASLCTIAMSPSSSAYMKMVQMAYKAARAWMEADNPSMAEASLLLASEFFQKQSDFYLEEHEASGCGIPGTKKIELETQRLQLVLHEIEVASALSQHQRAMDKLAEIKDLLRQHPKQAYAAVLLTYNLGVACYKQFNFASAAAWLNDSYDMGKGLFKMDNSKQSRTLRLLGRAYMETGDESNLQKALNALDLANTEHSHPAGLYFKLSILLKMKSSDSVVRQAMLEYLMHLDVSISLAVAATNEIVQHNRLQLAVDGLQQLAARFRNSPSEARIYLEKLELLVKLDQVDDANQVIDHLLSAQDYQPLTAGDRQRLHTTLWKAGAAAFDSGRYSIALNWYDYSAEFFSGSELETKNASKLQRSRCISLVELRRFDEASLAIQQAQQYDPDNPYSHFLLFKIALMKGDEDGAGQELKTMVQAGSRASRESVSDEDIYGLISLAAQLAFEKSNRKIALHALEGLIQYSPNNNQVLVALRCLVRLRCTFLADNTSSNLASIVFYIKTALEKIQGKTDDMQSEISWFMKMAWNVALQSIEAAQELHSLFVLCYKFSQLLPADNALLMRQKTCLLMAAAASLQLARDTSVQETREVHLKESLEHIKECQGVCMQLGKRQLGRNTSGDMAQVLLLLYEFECNSKLGRGGLQSILDRLADMDLPDGGTFETVAALAVDSPGYDKQVSMNALRLALHKYLAASPPDIMKYSKATHSLVQLALQQESEGNATEEEAFQIYASVGEVLDRHDKALYPEMEVVWLMTKAWNTGIKQFSTMRYVQAERWCSLSLNLLERLSSMKSNYESQMASAYAEILSKIEAHKNVGQDGE